MVSLSEGRRRGMLDLDMVQIKVWFVALPVRRSTRDLPGLGECIQSTPPLLPFLPLLTARVWMLREMARNF